MNISHGGDLVSCFTLHLVFKGWMGYIYPYSQVNGMKEKWFLIGVLVLGSFLLFHALPTHAKEFPRTLTLVYSNNINGEIDPCPT